MILHEILHETINKNVTFTYHEDVEGDKNRGWKVDRIDAFLPGIEEPVGYLNISYIPKERFKAHYPGILNYLSKMNGMSILPYEYKNADYHKIPPQELKKIISKAYIAIGPYPSTEEFERLKNLPLNEVIPEFEKIEKIAKKNYGLQYRQFKNYHVDKPLVDFIRVRPDVQRKGIATALHRAGYEWMKSRGLPYYASGTQTDMAKRVWDKLEKEYPVKKEKHWWANKPIYRKTFSA
jgi:GNAT superfamily N-acetyltransferase